MDGTNIQVLGSYFLIVILVKYQLHSRLAVRNGKKGR
jgi:hypothetical protein